PRRGRGPCTRRAGRSRAQKAAVEAVTGLLDTLDRRRDRLRPGEQQRLVAQLRNRAAEAGPWLTARQRQRITTWEETRATPAAEPASPPQARRPLAPAPAAAVKTPELPAAPKRRARARTLGPSAAPTDLCAVADAVRDVLEHTARLGPTISFDRLCTQVKGLSGLSEAQQRHALQAASARSRSPRALAALITTSNAEKPHPHYQHLAKTGAQAAWQQALAQVHAAYQPGPPPPGARPGGR
ncbi:hypothetical protein AABC07_11985, partial [Streptomyces sp. LNU-CPARS28]